MKQLMKVAANFPRTNVVLKTLKKLTFHSNTERVIMQVVA